MDFLAKFTVKEDLDQAIVDLKTQFAGFPVKHLLFFASPRHNSSRLAALMAEAFPGATTFGCTSFEEYCACRLHSGSISALAFGPGALEEFAVVAAENIDDNPGAMGAALDKLETALGRGLSSLEADRYFGMILFDGNPVNNIVEFIASSGDRSDITFIGGCASDFFTFSDTALYLDGQRHRRAALLAIIKPKGKFALLKTQNAVPTSKTFIVTRFDDNRRVLTALDNRPAVEVYAEALGLTPGELTPTILGGNPLGIVVDGEPFIRAIDSFVPGGGIKLIYPLQEGLPVSVFRSTDLLETTTEALAEKRRELGDFRAVVDFDCALRSLVLKRTRQVNEYGDLFKGAEMIGFSTYGEAFIGFSTQASVMALFG